MCTQTHSQFRYTFKFSAPSSCFVFASQTRRRSSVQGREKLKAMADNNHFEPPFRTAAAHMLHMGCMPIPRLGSIFARKKGISLSHLRANCEACKEPTYQRTSSNNELTTLKACRSILMTGTCNPKMPWLKAGLRPLIEHPDDSYPNACALKRLLAGRRTKTKARNEFKPMCNQFRTQQS